MIGKRSNRVKTTLSSYNLKELHQIHGWHGAADKWVRGLQLTIIKIRDIVAFLTPNSTNSDMISKPN